MKSTTHIDIIKKIKYVAVYLRKSRGNDIEEDLKKHKNSIEEHCEKNGWTYVVYEEIKSGADIEHRPEIKKVLKDVEEGMFDAVFVFDTDRLGRGGSGDQEKIFNTLKNSDTYLVTANPFKIYDLNDESDETLMDVHGFVAKMEYKQIRKRMVAGKKIGLKMGRWVHGNCPYGYEYNGKLKKLQANQEQKEVVRKIVDLFLDGQSTNDIAWILNRKRTLSPRGGRWSSTTISRILKSKVYLGYVIGNKSEGNKSKTRTSQSKPFRLLPESEWVVIKNCHEALISSEEHEKIMNIFKERVSGVKFANKINTFTSLVRCGLCGENMHHKEISGKEGLAKCSCGNIGGHTELIETSIYETVSLLKDKLLEVKVDDIQKQKEERLNGEINELEKELEMQDKAIERIEEAFEAGLYDVHKTRRKTEERQQEKWRLEKEISILRKQLTSVDRNNNSERISKINKFLNDIKEQKNSEEKNKVYKEIISEVIWTKPESNKVDVTVNFL